MKKVLIIGANSDIGQACAEEFLKKSHQVTLAAHHPEKIKIENCKTLLFDVQTSALDSLGNDYDIVLYIAGKMYDNDATLFGEEKESVMEVNYNAPVRILSYFAEVFKKKGGGTIAGVTSVAAVRGKSSTVVYGSAKAGFDNFLGGLRSFVYPTVRVVSFRLGYVDTKMTAEMDLPGLLTSSKANAAKTIVKNCLKGNRNIVYVKSVWRPISFIIKNIPEFIFKRLKI